MYLFYVCFGSNQSLLNVCTNHHGIFSQQITITYQQVSSAHCLVLLPIHMINLGTNGNLEFWTSGNDSESHGACQKKLQNNQNFVCQLSSPRRRHHGERRRQQPRGKRGRLAPTMVRQVSIQGGRRWSPQHLALPRTARPAWMRLACWGSSRMPGDDTSCSHVKMEMLTSGAASSSCLEASVDGHVSSTRGRTWPLRRRPAACTPPGHPWGRVGARRRRRRLAGGPTLPCASIAAVCRCVRLFPELHARAWVDAVLDLAAV